MRKVAVTGNIASGKSTICCLLKEQGAFTVDADAVVRELLKVENPVGQQVVKLLGSEVITSNQIDRKKISQIVFSNQTKLKALESILHPPVRRTINELFETVKHDSSYRCFVAEVPLLYEAQIQDDFDCVVAVIVDPQIARQRAIDVEDFDRRSYFQLPQAFKEARADFVIVNQGDLNILKAEVSRLIPKLCKEYE